MLTKKLVDLGCVVTAIDSSGAQVAAARALVLDAQVLDAATNRPPGRNALPGEERAACLDEVRAVLEPKLRDAAGTWVADYFRLRFAATKLKSIAA